MFVYTVKPGDSIFAISQKFDIPLETIRLVNNLGETTIVPGQALLLTTDIYTVQPGDSFYSIARMAFVTTDSLIAANPTINPNALQPGMKITLPKPPSYTASTFNYFYITGTPIDQNLISDFATYTTYYPLFEYRFDWDGSLSQLDDLDSIEAAWINDTAPLATITNLTTNGFSSDLTNYVLNNPTIRQNLVNNIYELVSTKGYAGVNIDIEGNLPQDRDIFSTFLTELKDRFQGTGLLLTIAVPPKTNENVPWHAGYDYGAIGSVIDLMFIMTYDWHHMESEPGPVAPISEVRATIEYALETMDSSKILLGVPLYGYNWTLPYNPNVLATAISNQNVINLAMYYNVPINYSEEYEAPFLYYYDDSGQQHVIWFEDPRSIAAKMELVREYGLQGIGAWQVGLGFPQGPWLLTNFFNIRKIT